MWSLCLTWVLHKWSTFCFVTATVPQLSSFQVVTTSWIQESMPSQLSWIFVDLCCIFFRSGWMPFVEAVGSRVASHGIPSPRQQLDRLGGSLLAWPLCGFSALGRLGPWGKWWWTQNWLNQHRPTSHDNLMVTSHSNALGLNLEDSVRKWFAYLYLLRYLPLPTNLYRIPVCYLFVYRLCILHVCLSISLYIVASQLVHISDEIWELWDL